MIRTLQFVSLLCASAILISCSSRSPILPQPGILHIGPSYQGLGGPLWSPDGAMIAVTNVTATRSWTSEIFLLDLAVNRLRSIERTEYGSLQARSWSPDGRQLAFSSEQGGEWPQGIWLADVRGMQPKQYLTDGYDAAWAPRGDRMAVFSSSATDNRQTQTLSIIDLGSMEKTAVFSGTGRYTTSFGLAWSPDGSKLLYSFGKQDSEASPRFPNVDIYLLELSTGRTTRLTHAGVNADPGWSPDGKLISYITHTAGGLDFTMMITDGADNCSRQMTTKAYSADWSPDGKRIAFDYAGEIYTLDVGTFLGLDFPELNHLCP